ncbi:hypothetical protein FRB94_000030 [Tulasnella sp. JGI-2019a]|nr:hypothetical protein FRB94_000030 [Tulasnella sp. JGI-2019a]KAG9039652.1 hypothetical protein FRB95_009233 [Tulasnella sp. JGI-2019a]
MSDLQDSRTSRNQSAPPTESEMSGSGETRTRSSIDAQTHHVNVLPDRQPAANDDLLLFHSHPPPSPSTATPSMSSANPPPNWREQSLQHVTLNPADILSLLRCVYCHELLSGPMTLRCGHTVCSAHVQPPVAVPPIVEPFPNSGSSAGSTSRTVNQNSASSISAALPVCPLEGCNLDQSARSAPILLPASSRVSYYPPPASASASASSSSSASTSNLNLNLNSFASGAGGGATASPSSSTSFRATVGAATSGSMATNLGSDNATVGTPSTEFHHRERTRVVTTKQDVMVSKILQIAVQAQATREARVRQVEAHRNFRLGKTDSGSEDDDGGDGEECDKGGEQGDEPIPSRSSSSFRPSLHGIRPSASSSSLIGGAAGKARTHSRSANSRSSSRGSASPPGATNSPSRRRRHPTSSPENSEEHLQTKDATMGGEPESNLGNSKPKSKKRKVGGGSTTTHRIGIGSDVRPRESLPNLRGGDDATFAKALKSELQCEICFAMLYEPVTTPCQHTFCDKCLSRTLDHSSQCPLCRQPLPGYAYINEHAKNQVLLAVMLKAFPRAVADRKASIEQEEKNARMKTPLFVCQLAFPGLPTILHIFEPRYRLMVRRCLQNPTPAFGMMMPPRTNGSLNDYGTMLEIKSIQMLPDGRSMVETKGIYRFRVLERGQLDGYGVGRVERIDDVDPAFDEMLAEVGISSMSPSSSSSPPSPARNQTRSRSASASASESTSPLRVSTLNTTTSTLSLPGTPTRGLPVPEPTVDELMQICREFYEQLRNGTAPWVVQQLNNTYGAMPTDSSTFSFWMAVLLPIDDNEKAKLLPIRSPRMRLKLIVHWIQSLNSSWWFSSGCIIC